MKIKPFQWDQQRGWSESLTNPDQLNPDLILFFTTLSPDLVQNCYKDVSKHYPDSPVVGCSSAGEIFGDEVFEDSFSATALEFESSKVSVSHVLLKDYEGHTFPAACAASDKLPREGLRSVIVISDGISVNGSELVRGVQKTLGPGVSISGGLAGDKDQFKSTYVTVNETTKQGMLVIIGLYGENLEIGHGSVGGWDEFGPVRKITASESNVLKEIDGEPALDLYKKYLGPEHVERLPGSALLFPILVYPEGEKEKALVRTVLSVSETEKTMTFAGDLPTGFCTQLMRANLDHIVDAAGEAAKFANIAGNHETCFALLISCVGRKMVLGQRTADEVESVQEILGSHVKQLGFYSNGEISPIIHLDQSCALHNQTMTITVIGEKSG